MPGLFSRLKGRDSAKSKKKKTADDLAGAQPQKARWDDAYTRKTVEPEEIHELVHCCTAELKARGLDLPFLLLPFRPTSNPSAVRTFIRHFFDQSYSMRGHVLLQELRMTEPMVIAGVTTWCWSRLQGGVVGWDAYDLFKVGEYDSNKARDSFKTFIPISVENGARQRIIFDFFDLIAAIAAHGKLNGFGGRQLSRMAAWWAFEHKDTGSGFDGGYKAWLSAADATSHLFFAYLRSLSPEQTLTGISMLPRSLEKLLRETEYPPLRPRGMLSSTNKLVMMVDTVSPTPFALLRRAGHFQYRDSDRGLQEFSNYEDPVRALTEECFRVLKAISSANQSQVSSAKHSTSLRDASWSRFEDIGFASTLDEDEDEDEGAPTSPRMTPKGIRSTPASGNRTGRPTTPSWADFLSSGFVDDNPQQPNLLLPPDKILPPIETQIRQHSSQSHRPRPESERNLEPGELASITRFELDDAFWWVWMSSLAPEETPERKSAFGRCAMIETKISSSRWIVVEEMIAGAAPEPEAGAYIAEKKRFFSWTRRGKNVTRRKSTGRRAPDRGGKNAGKNHVEGKTSVGADTHARIQAKAAQLRAMNDHEQQAASAGLQRRGRTDADLMADKTNTVFSLQPLIAGEASSAMKWVKKYDKGAIKDAYMANSNAGRGVAVSPEPSEQADAGPASNMNFDESVEQDTPPQVPAKDPSPAPSASIESPQRRSVVSPPPEPEHNDPGTSGSDRAEETAITSLERERAEQNASPAPRAQDAEAAAAAHVVVTSGRAKTSSERAKLQKNVFQAQKEKSGFRKLFARKNRASKLPENASADLNGMLRKDPPTAEATVQQIPTPAPTPPPGQEEPPQESDAPAQHSPMAPEASWDQGAETPVATEHPVPEYEPAAGEPLSGVDSQDAAEASREFSRFDQGPMSDQPAFVPEEGDEVDAAPPPIARHYPGAENGGPEKPKEELIQNASPGVQDRWAQIRKNAANRAATRQKEDPMRGPASKSADADDDTSGEETIESRVARIKARVAELTGNMDGTAGPQAVASRR